MPRPALRVCILGFGPMGRHHVRAVRSLDRARLVGVADPRMPTIPDAEKAAVPQDVMLYEDAEEMLRVLKPDVVHIATPPGSHVELAKIALEAGAHIYVEKPFAETVVSASEILALAEKKGLAVCAAHQVLFQDTARQHRKLRTLIGSPVHVESYFSFRPVRKIIGKHLMPQDLQLKDILPHPVYLLLDAMGQTGEEATIVSISVEPTGDLHAVLKKGPVTGLLSVTLRGRPVESFLKVVGTNGALIADFVLSGVTKLPGPGVSAISAVLQPYSRARQLMVNTTVSLFKQVWRRHRSYAGLSELVEEFYLHIQGGVPAPVSRSEILSTVRICSEIGELVTEAYGTERARSAERNSKEDAAIRQDRSSAAPRVLITGGTGFVGSRVATALARKYAITVTSRLLIDRGDRIPGVDYIEADLADGLPQPAFQGVDIILHLAAETSGGFDEHARNSVASTERLIRDAAACGVRKVVNISSIAVIKNGSGKEILSESSPLDLDNRERGPYVWGKAQAERIASAVSEELNVQVKHVRLGPVVDFDEFVPPGRLGREVGPYYVAVGPKSSKLYLCEIETIARVLEGYCEKFDQMPSLLNLVQPTPPTRQSLVLALRKARPDLTVLWMPSVLLRAVSLLARRLMKLFGGKALQDIAAAFAPMVYDTRLAKRVLDELHEGGVKS